MAKIYWNEKLKKYLFECAGCGSMHFFDARWTFNGDLDKPTVSPSLLVNKSDPRTRCHSFVEKGKIRFLEDCHHELRGQTVEIPEWDHSEWED